MRSVPVEEDFRKNASYSFTDEKKLKLTYHGHITNKFVEHGRNLVIDYATNLMWISKSPALCFNTYEMADQYVSSLNDNKYYGFSDWRIPTIEELFSILELQKNSTGSFINEHFEQPNLVWTLSRLHHYLSSDRLPLDVPWEKKGKRWYVNTATKEVSCSVNGFRPNSNTRE